MNRKVITALIIGLLTVSLGGCNWWNNAYEEAAGASFKVNVLKNPTALSMVKMMEPTIEPVLKMGDSVYYQIEQNSDELYTKLQAGEIEIATIPTEMAAKLYNDGAKYQIAAINTGGFIYVLAEDAAISNWRDLKGQEVSITGKGGTTDLIFRYLLQQNGIDPDKDLTLNYAASLEEQVQSVRDGESEIMVLPEPWGSVALSENEEYKIVLDVQEEWRRINGADAPLPQTSLVIKSELAANNHEAFGLFLEDYATSVAWVNQNPTEAAKFLAKHDIGVPEKLAPSVIPQTNLLFMSAKDAKSAVEKYLQVFLEASPDTIGGKLPDENFYYQ